MFKCLYRSKEQKLKQAKTKNNIEIFMENYYAALANWIKIKKETQENIFVSKSLTQWWKMEALGSGNGTGVDKRFISYISVW